MNRSDRFCILHRSIPSPLPPTRPHTPHASLTPITRPLLSCSSQGAPQNKSSRMVRSTGTGPRRRNAEQRTKQDREAWNVPMVLRAHIPPAEVLAPFGSPSSLTSPLEPSAVAGNRLRANFGFFLCHYVTMSLYHYVTISLSRAVNQFR